MKSPRYSLFFIFLICSAHTLWVSNRYTDEAKHWLNTYIFNSDGSTRISTNDIQAVANLIYFSWERSAITLKCQQEMLAILDIMWKGWQNVAQARLDPSIDRPYSIPYELQKVTHHFWELVNLHQSTGLTYTYAVKMILEKQIIQGPIALDGIADMRDRARKIVLNSLLDLRKQLRQFFNISEKCLDFEKDTLDLQADDQEDRESKKSINLMEYIYSYIPQLALHSFIEANSLHNVVSEEGWHALKAIQEVGNQTWKSIEETRAEFYATYYTALFEALGTAGLHNVCLKRMFNEQGIITKDQQEVLLPTPYKFSENL